MLQNSRKKLYNRGCDLPWAAADKSLSVGKQDWTGTIPCPYAPGDTPPFFLKSWTRKIGRGTIIHEIEYESDSENQPDSN
jgi:hypothetical protein